MNKKIIYLISLNLIACSTIDSSKIAPGYSEAFSSISNAVFGYKDTAISDEVILSIPYASLLMTIGKGPQGLLILESKVDANESWVSSDGALFIINNGRIVKTNGLQNNLTQLIYRKDSFQELGKKNKYLTSYYSYDVPFLRDLQVESALVMKGKVTVQLRSGEKKLNLIEEQITNKRIRWSALNKYWIDENGFVWKSEQTISPKLPKIYIEVTKKPSK